MTGARPGSIPDPQPLLERHPGEAARALATAARGIRCPCVRSGSYSASSRSSAASVVTVPATPIAARAGRTGSISNVVRRSLELVRRRRIGGEMALGQAHAADVDARCVRGAAVLREDELGRAAADVHEQGVGERRIATCRDPPKHHRRLLDPVEHARREPVAPLDLAEERLAVLRVAQRARADCERARRAEVLELAAVVGEHVPDARDRYGEEAPALVDALSEPGDRQAALDFSEPAIVDVGDEETRRVRPQVDRSDARHDGEEPAASASASSPVRSRRAGPGAARGLTRSRSCATRSRSLACSYSESRRSVRADRSSNFAISVERAAAGSPSLAARARSREPRRTPSRRRPPRPSRKVRRIISPGEA